jgi:hypothetical protein
VWRRESDTNFDGRVDTIEEFVHGNLTRMVTDTDFDGTADLLVLYSDGIPVYSQRASASQLAATLPSQEGSSLLDPFEHETAIRQATRNLEPLAGLPTSSKLDTLPHSRALPSFHSTRRVSSLLTPSSQVDPRQLFPRGPPASDSALL